MGSHAFFVNSFRREPENTIFSFMTSWLFPYDCKKFQLDRCLENQGFVEWHQLNKFQVGDIMYFYATTPVRRITHMMKVVKIDIKTEDTVDDSKFMTELYDIKLKSDPANFGRVPYCLLHWHRKPGHRHSGCRKRYFDECLREPHWRSR